ncbi:methionyl-tRNA formyltransferase [Candidatus Gracilibacteria bacterium]|nr:methionyl-tRNA formyltransferase [Candidatus Gracilibacteria bacterium]MCF7856167.1 methionyl-tRNA formyltransferase [Candidatus Gracilibacteria bacterium]MCF7896633.1 methionyl-tRNA formyltransferase [Candidatus Gracilibacteria bacterium]
MQKLKIAFAGTPDFAVESLRTLIADEGIEVVKVFTQPDKPAGRGQALVPPPVKVFAEENGVEVLQPEKLKKADLEGLDFLVVVAYGMILPNEALNVPQFGCVNLHASLLPKFRGASPIQSSILAGEEKTGVTFMQISEQLDSGDIFAQEEIEIGEKNSLELSDELAELGNKFPEILQKIAGGQLQPIAQDDSEATFCGKIKKEDGKLDWEKDSTEILVRKKRAFAGWPGVWCEYEGKILKLIEYRIQNTEYGVQKNGEVFEFEGKVFVKTIDGAIQLKKVQLAGKKILAAEDFAHGDSNFVGAELG